MATTASEYEMDLEPDDVEETADDGAGRVWGSLLTGAAIGFAVGGILAILYAQKSGPDLRSGLMDRVDDLRSRAEQVLDTLQETTSGLIAQSKATLDQTRENLVRSVEVGREAYEQKRDELTSRLEPVVSEPPS